MHPRAKLALVNRVLTLVSNTLSAEDQAVERDKLYAQLLKNRVWAWKFSSEFLSNEIEKLLDELRGVRDAEVVSARLDRLAAYLDSTPRENYAIQIEQHDYSTLASFPLRWRWTDARWNLLPARVLAKIRPLSKEKALEINERARLFHPDAGFFPGSFELVAQLEVLRARYDIEQVAHWLRQYIPDQDEPLVVSWDFENAVVTTAAILCDYWADFCYPASDDVLISPFSDEWVLFYWHEEVFFFGKRCES